MLDQLFKKLGRLLLQ